MSILNFLFEKIAASDDVKKAIEKGELNDEAKKLIEDFAKEREDFYKEKFAKPPVDEKALKTETYNEVMHTIRNFAKKHIDFELIKDKNHKEIFEALLEAKNAEIDSLKIDEKTEALKAALKERDLLKSDLAAFKDNFEAKIIEEKAKLQADLDREIKNVERKEIDRIWERNVLKADHKFDKDNQFYVDYLRVAAERKGFALVLTGENKDQLAVKKLESGTLVDAYNAAGNVKIQNVDDLIKELSVELKITPQGTGAGSGFAGLTERVMPDGSKIDITADLAMQTALGL